MTGVACGLIVGLPIGVAAARWWCRRRSATTCPDPEAQDLSHEDRRQIEGEFQAHAVAVHRQVGEFADALAGDDVVLRTRLRQFERGGRDS